MPPRLSFKPADLRLRDRVHLAAHLTAAEGRAEPKGWLCAGLIKLGAVPCDGNSALLVERLEERLRFKPK